MLFRGGHLELPPGVGLPGAAPQRHPVREQVVPLGVEVHAVQPHRRPLRPTPIKDQVGQVRQQVVRSRVVPVPTFPVFADHPRHHSRSHGVVNRPPFAARPPDVHHAEGHRTPVTPTLKPSGGSGRRAMASVVDDADRAGRQLGAGRAAPAARPGPGRFMSTTIASPPVPGPTGRWPGVPQLKWATSGAWSESGASRRAFGSTPMLLRPDTSTSTDVSLASRA